MKKAICFLTSIMLCFGVLSTLFVPKTERIVKAESNPIEKHFILNTDGSYGGSLNVELYGKGAPKNGEFDVVDSSYYTFNDFYNMKSTNEDYPLTLFPNFKPYQQTMENSSAFACLVMLFNYMGKDITGDFSELSLVNKYESYTSSTVKGGNVNEDTLIEFINSLNAGVTAEEGYNVGYEKTWEKLLSPTIAQELASGKIILTRYQSATGFGWKLIIGIDRMGTESVLDDTLIFADPFDVSDHYQDGYFLARLGNYMVWLRQVSPNGEVTNQEESIILDAGFTSSVFERVERDKTEKQTHYELHHILNADGTYGGTRDASKYGTISSGNGKTDVLYSNYYKTNDFYNMKDEGSRLLLEKYNTYQQTMSASCGICSMMSVLKYYGKPVDESWEVTLCEDYYEATNQQVNPSGTSTVGNSEVLNKYGLKSKALSSKDGEESNFPTFESYRDFMISNLKKDRPVMTSILNKGGHWVTVIGYDDMGTENIYDDVIIISDSSDYWDHYQDGYNTYSAFNFYSIHFNKSITYCQGLIYIEKDPVSIGAIIAIVGGGILLAGGIAVAVIVSKKKKAK